MSTSTNTPRTAGKDNEIQISDWQTFEKKTLRGFFTVYLPSGLVLRRCMLHEKGSSRWISFSSREWVDAHGVKQFAPIVEFRDRQTATRFTDSVLQVLDQHLAGGTRE